METREAEVKEHAEAVLQAPSDSPSDSPNKTTHADTPLMLEVDGFALYCTSRAELCDWMSRIRQSRHAKDKVLFETLKVILLEECQNECNARRAAAAIVKRSSRVQVRQLAELEEARHDRAVEEILHTHTCSRKR